MTPTALAVLERDSRLIADCVAPRRDGVPDLERWPPSRVRTGIVVGSVQSGKTSNMLAVGAHALDRGVGVLVILAGTRVALWLQTFERLLAQLDGSTTEDAWRRNRIRVLIPDPTDILGEQGRVDPRQYLRSQRTQFQSAVSEGRPAILVIPKEDSHLLELARFLRESTTPAVMQARATPLEMLVLDDEADDGSILEAAEGHKVTPRFIQSLWSEPRDPDHTWNPAVYATYVAYTATPHSNFLQAQHNPLAPRDFRAALRVPLDTGSVEKRSSTYREPEGAKRYYCGGHLFYEVLANPPGSPLVPIQFPIRQDGEDGDAFIARCRREYWTTVGDGLRAYFVAGALRLLFSGRRLSTVTDVGPMEGPALDALRPAPHCMLFHPSALKDLHFQAADDLARWTSAIPGCEDSSQALVDENGNAVLDPRGLARRLTIEEPLWRSWIQAFEDSAHGARMLPKGAFRLPSSIEWGEVRRTLIEEVFPATRLRVLNSDPRAAERPTFEKRPAPDAPGLYLPPQEIFSIFVAGNVLSRGLTIEGLCTSIFIRTADEPAADTQMQMQRWFGYRGGHLPLCRIFAFEDQIELFRSYHLNDEALKTEILFEMDSGLTAPQGPLVLQGEAFVATAKVDTRRVPLHPGPSPSIRVVEHSDPAVAQHNLDILEAFLSSHDYSTLSCHERTLRGLITNEPVGMLTVAELLEALRYTAHRPSPEDELYSRWASLGHTFGIPDPLLRLPEQPFVRSGLEPGRCPYSMAAYLRLWDALLERRDAKGVFPTDRPGLSWHLINLPEYRASRPTFYVGVRFGEEGPSSDPRLARRGVQAMRRRLLEGYESLLDTVWGSRGEGREYYGDQLLDYYRHESRPIPRLHDGVRWRPRGHPGLLLFHVVRNPDGGVDMLTAGLGLPHGGPDHIAALRGNPTR